MNRKVTNVLTVLLLSLLVAATATAEVGKDDRPVFSLTPYVGTTILSEDMGLEDDIIFGGRAAVHLLRSLSIEGTMGWMDSERTGDGSSVDFRHEGLDLVFDLAPRSNVNPYILGGWGRMVAEGGSLPATWKLNGWEVGGGLKWRLGGDNVNHRDLRLELRDVMSKLTDGLPNNDDMTHNLIVSAGLQFHFGRGSKDSDMDGVRDQDDACSGTPAGAVVDMAGCPVDSDGDGVYDGIDQCEGTPAGAVVDQWGCPSDSDGDGVFDGLDKCNDTPKGAKVDSRGCGSDSDGDGVMDGVDMCADTPEGAVVDARGCPVDSDKDGVFDGIDQCPDTAADVFVDDKGCALEVTETVEQLLDTGMIRTSDVRFRSGSAELNTADTAKLDEIGRTLVQWPELRLELSGHTDSQGSEAFNQKLSQDRANAVLDYLVAKFPSIDRNQFTVVGYGESIPIADNSTALGRAENRRVEFKVLNTDVIKRVQERRKVMKKN